MNAVAPEISTDAGELGDADRTADVLRGHLAGDDAPQHLHRERGHVPGLLDADTAASKGPERRVTTIPGGQTRGPSSSMIPSRPIGRPCSITRATVATIRNMHAAPLNFDRNIAARRAAHQGLEVHHC